MGSGSGHAAQATRPAQRNFLGPGRAGAATACVRFGKHAASGAAGLRMAVFGVIVIRFAAAADHARTRITGAIKSIGRLVPVGSTRRRACTPGLSTWSSSTALKGGLVLRGVSRLDAFSGYPVRT